MKRKIVKMAKEMVSVLELDDIGELTKSDIDFIAEVCKVDVLDVQDVLFNSEFV
jgi:hypothetical protein